MEFGENFVVINTHDKVKLPTMKNVERTEMYYFDENDNSCSQEEAVKFIAVAYDKNGKRLHETYGTIEPNEKVL